MIRRYAIVVFSLGLVAIANAELQDCDSCPEMIPIPAGSFQMGTPVGAYEVNPESGEGPPLQVTLRRAFGISRTEITEAQFARFVAETGHRKTEQCVPSTTVTDQHPVTCVDFDDATAYSQWLSQKTGQTYRLPSESEWEFAARSGTSWPRPWGANNSFEGVSISLSCDNANVYDVAAQEKYPQTWPYARCNDGFADLAPVASFPASSYGLHDMVGNVREWTADCYTASYWGRPPDERPWTWAGGCEQRVVRGGGWLSRPADARPARRHGIDATTRAGDLGFRVARVLNAAESPAPRGTVGQVMLFSADLDLAKAVWSQGLGYTVQFERADFSDTHTLDILDFPEETRLRLVMLAPANPAEPMIGLLGTQRADETTPSATMGTRAGQALLIINVADIKLTLDKLAALDMAVTGDTKPINSSTGLNGLEAKVTTADGTRIILRQLE